MKKTLIALAVGSAFAAPVAYADVTLSGSVNMGLAIANSGSIDTKAGNSVRPGGAVSTESLTQTSVTSNYTNVTISSVEDLGNGLKLDFAFQVVAPTNSNAGVSNRNSHIGLVGESWGGVWYGTNENLYERYFYTIDPLDGAAGIGGNLQMLGTPGYGVVFDAPNGNPNNVGGSAGFYRRTEHTLWYDSPNWGGFTFGGYTTLSPFKNNSGALENPTIYGFGAKYGSPSMPFALWAAYEAHKDFNGLNVITAGAASGARDASDTGIQLGGSFTLGDILLFAQYEILEYESEGLGTGAVNQYERDAFSVGMKWNLPSGYFGAQYIQALEANCALEGGGACNAEETGGMMIGLGYYHTMSKQTQVYIMGTYVDNDDLQNYSLAGAGTPNGGIGADHYAITVGIKHTF